MHIRVCLQMKYYVLAYTYMRYLRVLCIQCLCDAHEYGIDHLRILVVYMMHTTLQYSSSTPTLYYMHAYIIYTYTMRVSTSCKSLEAMEVVRPRTSPPGTNSSSLHTVYCVCIESKCLQIRISIHKISVYSIALTYMIQANLHSLYQHTCIITIIYQFSTTCIPAILSRVEMSLMCQSRQ